VRRADATIGQRQLRAADDGTFIDDNPQTLRVPVDDECTFYIGDPAVSSNEIGADIYVNGARTRVWTSGANEFAAFKVDRNGRVY